jgi:zinc-binding in reverse transcriptase
LGLPLTLKKPPKSAYLPLINNVQNRFEGFEGKYLTRAGRTVLFNSVLNAIPLHYMQAFLLPKWVINRINRITRRFIWKGNENTYSRGDCLVAWPKLTLPKIHGGLGIMDLSLQNKTLLVKWIWLAETDEACLWTLTLRSLHLSIGETNEGNDDHLSYFLKDLTTLLPYYQASGQFNQEEGTISWRWGQTFTARSMYKVYNNPGIEQNHLVRIWKIGIPNKIKIFQWLLLQDKLNTAENLQNKGWPSIQHCVLCNNGSVETRLHLFQTCRFTAAIISRRIEAARLHDGNFITGYEEAWRSNKQRAWTSIMWEILKERNARIFRQDHNSNFRVQQLIQDNIDIWIRAYST